MLYRQREGNRIIVGCIVDDKNVFVDMCEVNVGMRIAVCDDEQVFINKISEVINQVAAKTDKKCEVVTFENGYNVLDYCESHALDALFLDIGISGIDGFEVVKLLSKRRKNIIIVFVSSKDVMFEAQEYQPFRFVPKDRLTELPRIVNRLFEKVQEIKDKRTKYSLRIGKQIVDIVFDDIKYFESTKGHHIAVFQKSGVDYYRGTVNEIEEQLKQFGFLRIQAGYLVNYRYIDTINSRQVVLKDEHIIPISRERVKEARELFLKCKRSERW